MNWLELIYIYPITIKNTLIFIFLYDTKMNYTIELKNNWKIIDFDKLQCNIDYCYTNDFDWNDFKSDDVKIDIREHRNYTFQHDFDLKHDILDIDFSWYTPEELEGDYEYEKYKEELKKYQDIEKDYYVFWLDFYEHTIMRFSLVIKREYLGYYEFDRTRNVWIIAVKRDSCKDEKDAIKIAEKEIENYNHRCNGWIYQWNTEEKAVYTNKETKRQIVNYDFYDWVTGYMDIDSCKNDCMESIKSYLNSEWILYDSLELIEN